MNSNLKQSIIQTVEIALAEDVGSGDITAALIDENQQAKAQIISRENAVFCGLPWANEVFRQVDDSIRVNWRIREGDALAVNQIIAEIQGNARTILTAERSVLNFLQTLSGTATTTQIHAELIKDTKCRILDTRKTIPGLRLAQKYAVSVGGGHNHRIGLFDAVLIKENHILSTGSLEAAVKKALQLHGQRIMVEVEVESIKELEEALAAGAKRIMLDNFDVEKLKQAVEINQSRAELEASGNITMDNLRDIALTGVDYISLGALTKHIQAVDLSLLFEFID